MGTNIVVFPPEWG